MLCSFCALAQTVKPRITSAVKESQLTTLQFNTHPLARAEFDVGPAQPDMPLQRMLLVLKRSPEQEHALVGMLDQLQDKSSPNFHQWMTPDQFGRQFGAADSDIAAVTAWLTGHGFQVAQVSQGRSVIEFSGTAAQVQSAFHTSIHKYVISGEEHWANSSDPQIPTALTPVVSGVATLHNFFKKPLLHMAPTPIPVTRAPLAIPESTFASGIHALSPGDYATIYGLKPLYQAGVNGTGSSIAVVARTEIETVDVLTFQSFFGISNPIQVVLDGPDPGNLGESEEGEAVLDTTWTSSLATGATITMVISAGTDTTDGVDLSELYIIDHNLADVMTESFGSCEDAHTQSDADFTSNLAKQAAAQGITYMVSTGDNGASGCDNPDSAAAQFPISVNILASTPYTIAVGGTMFNEHGQDATYWGAPSPNFGADVKSYIPENAWNESCSAAQCGASKANLWTGSGGVSQFFAKPSWQAGVAGIPADGKRDVPDVSLTAAGHDPYLVCFEGSCSQDEMYGFSGTSASAPSFAAFMALIDQKEGGRQGQANYILYRLAAAETFSLCNGSKTTSLPGSLCVFNDITVGNNAVPGQAGYGTTTGKYQTTAGYDLATGLGSVNLNNLATQWNTVTFNATTTALTLTPTTVAHGNPVSVNVAVAHTGGTGTPTGTAVLQGSGATIEIDQLNVSAGVAAGTTSLLPGGTYDVIAHYSGDGTFGSSDSAATTVTVTPEDSVTALTLLTISPDNHIVPFTAGPFGSFVYPRADVNGHSGHGVPTGTVDFFDATNEITTLPLNSEGNTAPPNGTVDIAPGTHTYTAHYGGDPSFNPSVSPVVSFTISQAATSTSLTADKTDIGNNSTVNLTAKIVTDSLASTGPSGNVAFLVGGNNIGNALPSIVDRDPKTGKVSTTAVLQTSTLPVGDDQITASFTGDTDYVASTSNPVTVSVLPEFSLATDKAKVTALPGQSPSLTMTITGETGYSGTVAFTTASCAGLPAESTCSFNPASVTGSGSTTITITTTAPKTSALSPSGHTLFYAMWMTGSGLLGGIFLLPGVSKRRRNTLLAMVLVALLAGGTSCGGGGEPGSGSGGQHNDLGTPLGNYTIDVTAKSGVRVHDTSFSLLVN
jgi:subtilase family serine protease